MLNVKRLSSYWYVIHYHIQVACTTWTLHLHPWFLSCRSELAISLAARSFHDSCIFKNKVCMMQKICPCSWQARVSNITKKYKPSSGAVSLVSRRKSIPSWMRRSLSLTTPFREPKSKSSKGRQKLLAKSGGSSLSAVKVCKDLWSLWWLKFSTGINRCKAMTVYEDLKVPVLQQPLLFEARAGRKGLNRPKLCSLPIPCLVERQKCTVVENRHTVPSKRSGRRRRLQRLGSCFFCTDADTLPGSWVIEMQTHLQTRAEKSLGLWALLELKMWYEATSRGSGLVNKSAGKDGRGVSAEILVLAERK